LVRTVILVAAGGLVPPDDEAAAALRRLSMGDVPEEERRNLRRLALLAPASDPRLVDLFVTWPATQRAFQSALQATPPADWWHGGEAPMLVVQGLDDRMAPPANGRALAAEFPNRVHLIELPHAGHGLVVEYPEVIAVAICTWLQEHASHTASKGAVHEERSLPSCATQE
jgi:pimeloyl-ACP methyl ester carboxylesterase